VKLKVLHFFKTYHPETVGGIENMIFQLCRGSGERGVESSVLTLSNGPEFDPINIAGSTVYRARRNLQIASTGMSWSAFGKFARLAAQADVVHYHFPWPFMDLAHFCARVRKPTVVSYHSDIVKQSFLLRLYSPLMARFLQSVDSIVADCPPYAATSPVLRKYKDKVEVVSIGIDRDAYPKPSPSTLDRLRERFGSNFFLFVGAIRYYKGLHTLLAAAEGAPYPIVIAGIGPMLDELQVQARDRKIANVHFAGAVSDEEKMGLLKLSRGFVFPSHLRSEAFGISLLEAAMSGKPMISCDIGTGTTYVNLAGETGLVVRPNDPTSLRNAMNLLWESPAVVETMGKAAERRYWALFTADKMVDGYCAIYRRLHSMHAGRA